MSGNRSRRFRFTVRTMLAGVLMIGAILGWRVEQTRRQQTALRDLLATGRYAVTMGPSRKDIRERDLADDWLRAIFGRSRLADDIVIFTYNCERPISHEESYALHRLRGLRKLVYTSETSDVARLKQALSNCEVCPLTISHQFQLDVF